MNRRTSNIMSVIVIIAVVLCQFNSIIVANAKTSGVEYFVDQNISRDEKDFVMKNKDEYLKIISSDKNLCANLSITSEDLEIGKPFLIYYPDITQEMVDYYPVIYKKHVICTIDVVTTSQGYSVGFSDEFVDLLNENNYISNPCIFYYTEGKIYIQNRMYKKFTGLHIDIRNKNSTNVQKGEFSKKTFYDKQKIICRDIPKFKKVTLGYEDEIDYRLKKYKTTLSLHNPMGQYDKGMCWAASTATVVNYVKKKGVTAYDVCNLMGINYNKGASMYVARDALSRYGISNYNNVLGGACSQACIRENIDNNHLLLAGGTNDQYGMEHMVVICGYEDKNVTRYKICNPANKNGQGGYGVRQYNDGICAVVSGISFQWRSTLCVN